MNDFLSWCRHLLVPFLFNEVHACIYLRACAAQRKHLIFVRALPQNEELKMSGTSRKIMA